jgi:hypothetical protein
MSYLSTLKKSNTLDLDHLAKVIESQNNPTFKKEVDERFWKPERDKAGNAYASIRFLPPAVVNGNVEDVYWVRMFDHAFKGPTGKWYIEKSLTTIDQKDPLGEYNSFLWNSTNDDNSPERKQARAQKRRQRYISNILVVKDPKNPQNEGKVFLFSYGKKVFDKIQGIMFPKFAGAPKINPFDPLEGANFNLVIEQVAGFPNYDQCRFDAPSPIGTEDEINAICSQAHSLKELIAPHNFKSREELQRNLNAVLGFDVAAYIANETSPIPAKAAPKASPVQAAIQAAIPTVETDIDDTDLEEFRKLIDA